MEDTQEELAALGLLSFAGERTGSRTAGTEALRGAHPQPSLVQLGTGLPALPKRLADKMQANKFVDVMKLPPARGKSKPLNQDEGSHIVVVQAAELASTRKIIPDLGTWLQCFALYAAAILQAPA